MTRALSADAKDALAHDIPQSEHCRSALRESLALYGAAGSKFRTRRLPVARLFRALQQSPGEYAIVKSTGRRLYKSAEYEIELPASAAPRKPTARCDRRMELRGAFLACGSLAAPNLGYHLEFFPSSRELAERLHSCLIADGHRPKESGRRGKCVLYFKDADAIVRLLTAIGAYNAVLQLEDVRALKETKNRIRRLVNTEAANVDRSTGAAALQRDAIRYLADAYGLRNLSPPLREVATLRLAYPADTLAELGRRCVPPVGKSTLNGRMNALLKLAHRCKEGSAAAPGY